ncbi:CDP-alcohol phosphatidyltransferase family protein [Agrobacterium larrymoorei]|uniref:CDP-alcohol phosphatidyltransferase family protein n=1 Tax=Agrobacterium larrymoorei TaxID=160699 RepID=A0A4D7DZ52_9HYPH|nr:CDP-alcohol phosphatidyltransferase family protein [Agrobacterium larrymoorei]QCI99442.1 CDP-alcohol phosphatidyltransferase family protein [Agrobacterium larrymoorei]QYA08986.1 CDP-alcohol phosphatidyltransferase family protein [Agrobacterium larrymoorei]
MALIHGDAPHNLRDRKPLIQNTLAHLACLMIGTIVVALVVRMEMSMGWDFVAAAVLSLSIIFGFVVYLLPSYPHRCFGYANIVTAFRASLVSLTGATVLCFESLQHADTVLWILVGVVLFALALDGIDGYLARRYRQESELGARFDMEVDAFLILILSVAAAMLDKAGAWVLLIGLMRYLFVAAGWFLPVLNGELPSSLRRKFVCVVQVATLCLILVPAVSVPLSSTLAAISLMLLATSFAIDIAYLLRKRVAG